MLIHSFNIIERRSMYDITCLVLGISQTGEEGINTHTYTHTYACKTTWETMIKGGVYKALWEPRGRVKFLLG